MRNKPAVLRRASAFSTAAPEVIRRLARACEPSRISRHGPLWTMGSADADPVVVRSGVLRERVQGRSPFTLEYCGRGGLLGTESLHGGGMGADVEAYEEAVVLSIPRAALLSAAAEDSGLAIGLAVHERDRRLQIQVRMGELVDRTAVQRLATTLIRFSATFGVRDSRGTIVNIRLTHRELASYIGSTRETISFAVGDLRERGLIETDGKRYVVLDRRALLRLAESEGRDAP